MRFCEVCQKNPVWGTDKLTKIGYCKNHQYLRTDVSKETILQKALKKQKANALKKDSGKVRSIAIEVKPPKDYQALENWFKNTRKKLTGRCQCGCNKPSSKFDDRYYKHSCSHVFPKAKFASVATHPRNFVERAFWGGCHSVMDDTSMGRWMGFADWENIKEIFHELAPLLTDEERATKFYSHFERLIYGR